MLVLLFIESEGRLLRINDPFVTSHLSLLKELARRVYAVMIVDLAKNRQISLKTAAKTNWSATPEDLKQKYILIMEERALKEYHLDIGRCVESWSARGLMQSTKSSMKSVVSVQKHYFSMICSDTHDCCNIYLFRSVTNSHFFYMYKIGKEQGSNNNDDGDRDKQATSNRNPVRNPPPHAATINSTTNSDNRITASPPQQKSTSE